MVLHCDRTGITEKSGYNFQNLMRVCSDQAHPPRDRNTGLILKTISNGCAHQHSMRPPLSLSLIAS